MENLSLFNMPEPAQEQMKFQHSNKLDVVKMEFVGAETMTWQDLFSGFDTLHAITYSSGINFIYRLLDFFEEAEVIFGCDEVLSYCAPCRRLSSRAARQAPCRAVQIALY